MTNMTHTNKFLEIVGGKIVSIGEFDVSEKAVRIVEADQSLLDAIEISGTLDVYFEMHDFNAYAAPIFA